MKSFDFRFVMEATPIDYSGANQRPKAPKHSQEVRQKQIQKCQKELDACQQRLNNPNFLSKAKPEVVDKERDKLKALEEKLKIFKSVSPKPNDSS